MHWLTCGPRSARSTSVLGFKDRRSCRRPQAYMSRLTNVVSFVTTQFVPASSSGTTGARSCTSRLPSLHLRPLPLPRLNRQHRWGSPRLLRELLLRRPAARLQR